jgi:hypothetical protein
MDINVLLKRIEEKRDCGVVHLLVFNRSENVSWEEAIFEKSKEIPFFSWHSIWFYRKNKKDILQQPVSIDEVKDKRLFHEIDNKDAAVAILAHLLHKDMAYGSEIMPIENANKLATSFVAAFDEGSQYYSNSIWNKNEYRENISGFNPVTEATFDSGIIVVDKNKIGIAWCEEEE